MFGYVPVSPVHTKLASPFKFNMFTQTAVTSTLLAALAAAAPRPQVAGYTDADASFTVSFDPAETPATFFGPGSLIPGVRSVCLDP